MGTKEEIIKECKEELAEKAMRTFRQTVMDKLDAISNNNNSIEQLLKSNELLRSQIKELEFKAPVF